MKIQELPADDKACGWFHLSKNRPVRPAHAGQTRARWAVVGAGFTGLAAARQLALNFPDDEVVLVEAQQVGYGASGRNSGFAIDLPHDLGAPDYIGDPATARMNLQLNLAAQAHPARANPNEGSRSLKRKRPADERRPGHSTPPFLWTPPRTSAA